MRAGRLPTLTLAMLSLPTVPAPKHSEIPLYEGDVEADLRIVSRSRLAERITGGLSRTSKMPCPSWSISALRCLTGAKLARVAGTVCRDCYAMGGNYARLTVLDKQEHRFEGLGHPHWVPAMIFQIRWECFDVFRWFDAGDLQSVNHLRNINTVALHTQDIRHWLPTREREIVLETLRRIGSFAPNLLIRASGNRIDGPPPRWWPTTSTVVSDRRDATCPAPQQDNRCGGCRVCWDPDAANVAYLLK